MSREHANHAIEQERKHRTDMEICFDGRSVAIDYTVPNRTLTLKHRSPGVKYEP